MEKNLKRLLLLACVLPSFVMASDEEDYDIPHELPVLAAYDDDQQGVNTLPRQDQIMQRFHGKLETLNDLTAIRQWLFEDFNGLTNGELFQAFYSYKEPYLTNHNGWWQDLIYEDQAIAFPNSLDLFGRAVNILHVILMDPNDHHQAAQNEFDEIKASFINKYNELCNDFQVALSNLGNNYTQEQVQNLEQTYGPRIKYCLEGFTRINGALYDQAVDVYQNGRTFDLPGGQQITIEQDLTKAEQLQANRLTFYPADFHDFD